jgi:NADH:ubiquinone oxidoreductase subunit
MHIFNIGTLIYTLINGVMVGTDEFGNRYYRARKDKLQGRERRWVLYRGKPEASRVPPEWHAWLHHTTDQPLSQEAAESKP